MNFETIHKPRTAQMESKQRYQYNKWPTTWMKLNVCHRISSVLAMEPHTCFQGTSCARALTNGSPHRIPPRTTTLRVILITRKQQHGFLKVAHIKSGSQQTHFFGSTENVCPVLFPTRLASSSDTILPCSWFWKKRHLVRKSQIVPVSGN